MQPTGILSTPKHKLRELVAETAAWRAWVGAQTALQAREKVFYSVLADEVMQALRPLAVIQLADYSLAKVSCGVGNDLWPREPKLRLIVQDNDRANVQVAQNQIDPDLILAGDIEFENRLGDVLAQMAELAAVDDRLAVSEIRMETPIVRNPREDWASQGVYMWSSWLISFE